MKLHLLLTVDIAKTMRESTKIIHDWGDILVVFGKFEGKFETKHGKHCVVEDTTENIISWLKPYDSIIKGNGTPMAESFEIVHIKDEL